MPLKNTQITRHLWPTTRAENEFQFYQIKRVFLACPGDLMAERSRFPRLLETVNNLRAHSLGFHLQPVGWERVIPSFGRPQSLINAELRAADLVVVMFWNRIGSPSSAKSEMTATVEEFEEAIGLFEKIGRPLVWVYFKKPNTEVNPQLEGVLNFRRELESGKQIFFRDFEGIGDWEEMFREHLVAYLDGMKRWDLDSNFQRMNPEQALMRGRFLGEGIYSFGTRLTLQVDLDGDDYDETVSFWFSHGGYSLSVTKFDRIIYLELPAELTEDAGTCHLAVKDVTNDGFPEVLLAFSNGIASLIVGVWGFKTESRELTKENFGLLHKCRGQNHARILEGGTILLPYGSIGCKTACRWNGKKFIQSDE